MTWGLKGMPCLSQSTAQTHKGLLQGQFKPVSISQLDSGLPSQAPRVLLTWNPQASGLGADSGWPWGGHGTSEKCLQFRPEQGHSWWGTGNGLSPSSGLKRKINYFLPSPVMAQDFVPDPKPARVLKS